MDNGRIHNCHLMADFANAGYTPKTLQLLNNCRMFLQVTTLAKIMNHAGTHLLPNILHQSQSNPTLDKISASNYNWPNQPKPGHSTWKIRMKALQSQYTKPGLPAMLCQPLRHWKPQAATVCTWFNTFNPTTHQIITKVPIKPMLHYTPPASDMSPCILHQYLPFKWHNTHLAPSNSR